MSYTICQLPKVYRRTDSHCHIKRRRRYSPSSVAERSKQTLEKAIQQCAELPWWMRMRRHGLPLRTFCRTNQMTGCSDVLGKHTRSGSIFCYRIHLDSSSRSFIMTIDVRDIKIGDLITFRSPTRSGNIKARRKVTAFWTDHSRGSKGVHVTKFHGWDNFVVFEHEILEHEKTDAGHLELSP